MLTLQDAKTLRNPLGRIAFYSIVMALLAVLTILPMPNRVSAQQQEVAQWRGIQRDLHNSERIHPPPSTQTIYAPFGLPRLSQAELVLNNNSPNNMDVAPLFYTAEGIAVNGQTLTLKPAEVRHVNVSDLQPPDQKIKKVSGMTLTYFGGMLEVGAQITVLGKNGSGSFDIPFSAAMKYRSLIQEAVWWMPKNAEATILLGNPTDTTVAARLRYSNGESQDILIEPFATESVQRKSIAAASSEGTPESVRLEVSGPLGSIRATGFVTSVDKRFHSGIQFYDPGMILQPHLFATNLRLKKSEPRLVLKNISDQRVSARPRFIPLAGEGDAFELPVLSLEPRQTIEVNLKSLKQAARARSDFDLVSAQVVNDSGANNLIGALYSTNSKTLTTYDVPLRDSGPVSNSTGSYPWRVDGDYSTIISITNTRDTTAKYRVSINYEGGKYTLNPKELAAGETAVFDLKKLRDEQVTDKSGNTIPASVNVGQFRWSLIGDDTFRLIGRSEIVSVSKNVSSSYSCPVCCPDSFAGFEFNPGISSGPVGGTAILAVDSFYYDCYFNLNGPYADVSLYNLWVQHSSVLSMNVYSLGSAQLGCLSVGQSQFGGTAAGTWYDNDGMDCYPRTVTSEDEGTGEVLATWSLGAVQFTSPSGLTIRPGETGKLSVTISASAGMPANATATLEITWVGNGSANIAVDPDTITLTTSPTTGVPAGTSRTFMIDFDANSSQPNPGTAVTVTGHARIPMGSETNSTVTGMREKDSSNMLLLQK
jgi:hypothetical protein